MTPSGESGTAGSIDFPSAIQYSERGPGVSVGDNVGVLDAKGVIVGEEISVGEGVTGVGVLVSQNVILFRIRGAYNQLI